MKSQAKAEVWEDNILSEYRDVINRQYGNIIDIMDAEDAVQTRMLYLCDNLDALKKFTDKGHFRASLRWYVRKRQIRTHQQRDNLVSLDSEQGQGIALVSLPRDYHLYRHIIRTGRWSRRQLRVLSRRYLSGKTQREISTETGIPLRSVKRLWASIDRKLLTMDLKQSKGSWYHGQGNNLPSSQLWDTSSKYEQGIAEDRPIMIPSGVSDQPPRGRIPDGGNRFWRPDHRITQELERLAGQTYLRYQRPPSLLDRDPIQNRIYETYETDTDIATMPIGYSEGKRRQALYLRIKGAESAKQETEEKEEKEVKVKRSRNVVLRKRG